MNLSLLFSLEPVFRGFIAMLISGACFPLCGVLVLRLDLVNLRYMLMHGVILGGAIALALNVSLVPVIFIVNLLLIIFLIFLNDQPSLKMSGPVAATMVLTMALASIIMHLANVPAKDTLSILWGSPFALKSSDLIIISGLVLLLIFYISLNFKNILALFFNQEVAKSLGVNVRINYTFMVLVIALVVAVAMKLLGAFLIDALLILPVLSAASLSGKKICGIKKLFILSSVLGFIFSAAGYIIAVGINWPPAATISVVSGAIYIISVAFKKFTSRSM